MSTPPPTQTTPTPPPPVSPSSSSSSPSTPSSKMEPEVAVLLKDLEEQVVNAGTIVKKHEEDAKKHSDEVSRLNDALKKSEEKYTKLATNSKDIAVKLHKEVFSRIKEAMGTDFDDPETKKVFDEMLPDPTLSGPEPILQATNQARGVDILVNNSLSRKRRVDELEKENREIKQMLDRFPKTKRMLDSNQSQTVVPPATAAAGSSSTVPTDTENLRMRVREQLKKMNSH